MQAQIPPRQRRETLGPRDAGTEKLLAGLPIDLPRLDPLRRWARAIMADASRFQIEKAKERNSLTKWGR